MNYELGLGLQILDCRFDIYIDIDVDIEFSIDIADYRFRLGIGYWVL